MSQVGQRLVFQNAKNLIENAGLNPGKAVLSQSYLRLEVNLVAGQTAYTFDTLVNENTNPQFVTQQKLNLQDAFIVSNMGVFLGVPATAAVTETAFQLCTYPNQVIFTGTNDVAALGVYAGWMTLTVNQRTIVTNWDLQKHYCVNQTQQLVARAAATPFLNLDQNCGLKDGFAPVEPNLVLIGSKKNIVQIILPQGLTAVEANSRLIIIYRGILAQNCTSVN